MAKEQINVAEIRRCGCILLKLAQTWDRRWWKESLPTGKDASERAKWHSVLLLYCAMCYSDRPNSICIYASGMKTRRQKVAQRQQEIL